PDRLDLGVVSGGLRREWPGGVARPLSEPLEESPADPGKAAHQRFLEPWARIGRARAHGVGEHRLAIDSASPVSGLWHGGPGQAAWAGLVDRHGDLGRARRGRIPTLQPDVDGALR